MKDGCLKMGNSKLLYGRRLTHTTLVEVMRRCYELEVVSYYQTTECQ